MTKSAKDLFPTGRKIKEEDLYHDPYPIYDRLQRHEPVSWIECLNMFYVVDYADVDNMLKNSTDFLVGQERSLNCDTFGAHMLTVDGKDQQRFKAKLRGPFMPKFIRENLEGQIRCHVNELIDGFCADGQTELRKSFAARLPILTMLSLFGLPQSAEAHLRRWYDSFEKALTNFSWNPIIRKNAQICVREMHEYFQKNIDLLRKSPDDHSLLSLLVNSKDNDKMTDDEIKRNLSIVFFGGISTVEALILNAVYLLSLYPEIFRRVRNDYGLLPQVLEETIRCIAPVQSATRHVARDLTFQGILMKEGDVVSCMLGAANRDPRVFKDPELFDIDRPNLNRHLGFAIGPHHCLGSNLARLEARIALEQLLNRLPECKMNPENIIHPQGFEFRQPSALDLIWHVGQAN
jgi:cytochrome P450